MPECWQRITEKWNIVLSEIYDSHHHKLSVGHQKSFDDGAQRSVPRTDYRGLLYGRCHRDMAVRAEGKDGVILPIELSSLDLRLPAPAGAARSAIRGVRGSKAVERLQSYENC